MNCKVDGNKHNVLNKKYDKVSFQRPRAEKRLPHVIDNDRTALGAIKTGVEIERNARGIPDALLKIAEMRDEELGDVVSKLLAKVNPDEALKFTGVINITEKPDTVDAEFKEETEEVVDDGGTTATEQTE